jgi:hypothetical protein
MMFYTSFIVNDNNFLVSESSQPKPGLLAADLRWEAMAGRRQEAHNRTRAEDRPRHACGEDLTGAD